MARKICVIQPSGIFDGAQAATYRSEIEQIMASKTEMVVIDFKDVTFMDSSGLGTLVQYLQMTRDAKCRLLLCSLNEQIQMLLELTSMDKMFEIFPGREELETKIMDSRR